MAGLEIGLAGVLTPERRFPGITHSQQVSFLHALNSARSSVQARRWSHRHPLFRARRPTSRPRRARPASAPCRQQLGDAAQDVNLRLQGIAERTRREGAAWSQYQLRLARRKSAALCSHTGALKCQTSPGERFDPLSDALPNWAPEASWSAKLIVAFTWRPVSLTTDPDMYRMRSPSVICHDTSRNCPCVGMGAMEGAGVGAGELEVVGFWSSAGPSFGPASRASGATDAVRGAGLWRIAHAAQAMMTMSSNARHAATAAQFGPAGPAIRLQRGHFTSNAAIAEPHSGQSILLTQSALFAPSAADSCRVLTRRGAGGGLASPPRG